jgi:hypothetical protein
MRIDADPPELAAIRVPVRNPTEKRSNRLGTALDRLGLMDAPALAEEGRVVIQGGGGLGMIRGQVRTETQDPLEPGFGPGVPGLPTVDRRAGGQRRSRSWPGPGPRGQFGEFAGNCRIGIGRAADKLGRDLARVGWPISRKRPMVGNRCRERPCSFSSSP